MFPRTLNNPWNSFSKAIAGTAVAVVSAEKAAAIRNFLVTLITDLLVGLNTENLIAIAGNKRDPLHHLPSPN